MTQMFPFSFGVPQWVVRSGTWAKMKGAEKGLYVALLHESERLSSRVLRCKDGKLSELSGAAPRTIREARINLQYKHHVVNCVLGPDNVYSYTLLNADGEPWPGDPRTPIKYQKKSARSESTSAPVRESKLAQRVENEGSIERHGVPLKFGH